MKRILLLLIYFCSPLYATSYFLAPAAQGGSDSNNGTSSVTPWLSPNHAVNCGDVLQAAAGTTYSAANFASGKWGTVTCAAGNNVAWLKCITFDACKINGGGSTAVFISASYWGIQGFELTSSGSNCLKVEPAGAVTIHHVIIANNIANVCAYAGFEIDGGASGSVDYFAVVGNISYKAAYPGSAQCSSAINTGFMNGTLDKKPGTHVYFAGNFAYDTLDPNPCNGGSPTDGEGLFFDSLNMSEIQVVIDNNMALFNGGRGIQSYLNSTSRVYIRHNTTYGNNTQTGQSNVGICGEITINASSAAKVYGNLTETTATGGCAGNAIYAYAVLNGGATDKLYNNYGYDASSHNIGVYNSAGFVPGPKNTFGDPSFANPVDPGAPSCGSASSVPNCMAKVIANFTPTAARAAAYGYQPVQSGNVIDPLFPQWLCNLNLPPGLVTMGCQAGP